MTLKGNGCDLEEVLSQYLPREVDENHENPVMIIMIISDSAKI
jgi:hypothetical protein